MALPLWDPACPSEGSQEEGQMTMGPLTAQELLTFKNVVGFFRKNGDHQALLRGNYIKM